MRGRRPLSQEVINTTIRLYEHLGSATLVAEKLGLTPSAIQHRMKKAGIKLDGKPGPRPRQFVYTPVKPVWTPDDIYTPEA